MLTLSLSLCRGDNTRQSPTRLIHKNCTAVYSAQEPGFEVPHLVVQGLASTSKLTTITRSFREHRPGHLAQTSEAPSLQPRIHSLGWLPSAFTADLQARQPIPSPQWTMNFMHVCVCVRACVYTTSSVSPHSLVEVGLFAVLLLWMPGLLPPQPPILEILLLLPPIPQWECCNYKHSCIWHWVLGL